MKRQITFLIVFIINIFQASGQEKQKEDSAVIPLDEVIVIAQRTGNDPFFIPYSTNVLTKHQMDQTHPRTTPEALTGMNGIFIQKTNHAGGSPFIRGLTGNQTLLLIDGIRLNNSTFRYGPNQYLNTIDAYSIQKIEVARGTGSVQYGTDALGGVIQVYTREPAFSNHPTWSGRVAAKYMSSEMEKTIRSETGFGSSRFASQLGVTYRNFGDLAGGDSTGKQTPSGYNEFDLDAKLKFQCSKNLRLLLANQFIQQKHVPFYHKVVLENFLLNEIDPQQRLLNYAKLELETKARFVGKMAIIISSQQTLEGRNSRKNGSPVLRKEKDKISITGITADAFSIFSKTWTANSGVEMYHDKVNSARHDINTESHAVTSLRGLYPDNSHYGNYAIYTLHHFRFNKWVIDGGARFNTFSIRITDTTMGRIKNKPSAFVYNMALLYRITEKQHVYANLSSGYRAPNIDDLGSVGIVDFRYEIPAPHLEPEKTAGTELGYRIQSKKISASVAAYYMHLSDLITRIKMEGMQVNGYAVYKKENTDEAYIKGIESELTCRVTREWLMNASIAYAYGQNLSKHEPLRRIPPLNGRLMSSFRKKNWFTTLQFLFVSGQTRLAQGDKEDNRIPKGGTPGWQILDFYCGYHWKHFAFDLGFQNIFNQDYRTHGSGINGAGRNMFLSFQYIF